MKKYQTQLSIKITLILLLFSLNSYQIFAQRPVQIIPQLLIPASPVLSDYYSSTIPKIFVTATNRDLQEPQLKVKLKLSVSSFSIQINTAENIQVDAITLDAGIPYVFSPSDLQPYFNINNLNFTGITKQVYQQSGKLPEGIYNFCFQVLDFYTNEELSNFECATAWISLVDPPLLNLPMKNETVEVSNPQFITFNWTPRHLNSPNSAFNYEYEFQMVEILDNNIDPNAAFLSSPIFYSTSLSTSTFIYGVEKPQMVVGRRYAWRIKVKPANLNEDYDEIKNGGNSEIYWFDYNYGCPENLNFEAIVLGNGKDLSIDIPNITGISECRIIIKNKLTSAVVKDTLVLTAKTAAITDLERGNTYEIYFNYQCRGSIIVSQIKTVFIIPSNFGTLSSNCKDPVNLAGKVLWVFNKDDNQQASVSLIENELKSTESIRLSPISSFDAKPLKDAIVEVYYMKNGRLNFVANSTTDKDGNYNFNIVPDCRTDTFIYVFKHPSASFSEERVIPEFINGVQTFFARYREVVLKAKSFVFEPKIVTTGVSNDEVTKLKVEILIDNISWDILYKPLENQIENLGNRIYNGHSYHIVAKVNAENLSCNLFQNINGSRLYIAVANMDAPSHDVDFVIPSTNEFVKIKSWFDYQISKRIKGRVASTALSINEAIVKIAIKREWLVDKSKYLNLTSDLLFQTTTNTNGEYSFDIPRLVDGTVLEVSALNRTYSSEPEKVTTPIYHYNNDDIPTLFLKYKFYNIIGRLMVFESTLGFPVEGAKVFISGSSYPVTTNKEGFFLTGSNWDSSKTVTFIQDGYTDLVIPMYRFDRKPVDPNSTQQANDWADLVRGSKMIVDTNFTKRPLPLDASLFYSASTQDLNWIYNFQKAFNPDIQGIIDAGIVKLPKSYKRNNNVYFKFLANGKLVSGDLKIYRSTYTFINWTSPMTTTLDSNLFRTETGKAFELRVNQVGLADAFSYEFKESDGLFKTARGTFYFPSLSWQTEPVFVEVHLQQYIRHTLTVFKFGTHDPIPFAVATAAGRTFIADNSGRLELILEPGIISEVTLSKSGFTGKTIYIKDPWSQEVSLSQMPLEISKLCGFDVRLNKQDPGQGVGNWIISGELTIANNSIFSANQNNTKLHFENLSVKTLDLSGNSFPMADVTFNEATINATLFNYIPVEIHGIKLSKPATAGDYSLGIIGGNRIDARLSIIGNNSFIPVSLPDAQLIETDANNTGDFKYAFKTPGIEINAFRSEKSYNLNFGQSSGNSEFLAVSLLPNVFAYINKNQCNISNSGINLPGHFQFPSEISSQADNNGQLNISTFKILPNLRSYDLRFDLSSTRPFFVKLQKIQAKITQLMITGLGTPNCGVGFGGDIWIKEKPRESTTRDGVITIHELSIINAAQGVTLTGRFSVPEEGVAIKNLVFKTPGSSYIGFSFNFSEANFNLDASGRLEVTEGGSAALSKIFPIEIQTFKLRTKEFGLFIIARPNIKVELGPVKITINTFLVNVGYNASMDAMAEMLNTPTMQSIPAQRGGPNELIDESRVNWAIGIGGEIEFPIRGITIGAGGKVLVGNINNSFEFRVTQISLRLESPAFTLTASVGLSLSGQRQGFEGGAELTLLGNGLGATFKFYQLYDAVGNKTGIELGASINLQSSTGITTGPITWLSIGGGFDFNTRDQRYEIWLSGDVTATGTPREAMYVSIARIGIVFDIRNCGAAPVLDGTGRLFIKNEEWLSLSVRTDFCRMLFFLELRGSIPILPALPRIQCHAIIFAMAPYQGRTGCVFFYASATISSNLINGNITMALGYNYNNTQQLAPQEIKDIWHLIDARAKDNNGTVLNAIMISAIIEIPRQHNSFGVSIGTLDLFRFYYDFYADASAFFMYKFSDRTLLLRIRANAEVKAGLTLFGASLHGYAYAFIDITGGYDGVWYCYGDVRAGIQLWNGESDCNKSAIQWYESCVWLPWVPCCNNPFSGCFWENCPRYNCTWLPGPIVFKVCLDLNLNWYVRQGEPTRVSIGRR